MTDLKFDHTKDNVFEALSISKTDLKKFYVDIDEHMVSGKSRHSEAIDFIWGADQSFEMKIAATFALGGIVGFEIDEKPSSAPTLKAVPLSVLRELFKELKKEGLL